jgi:hypothetical protein
VLACDLRLAIVVIIYTLARLTLGLALLRSSLPMERRVDLLGVTDLDLSFPITALGLI